MALVGKISIAMMADTAKFKSGLASAQRSLQSFEKSATGTGALIAGAFTAAFGAASAIGFGKMISAASDLSENINKVQSIFGKAAGKITADADAMAEAFGTSKNEFLDASGKLGGLFKGAGFTEGQAADLASQFVKLSGDASSFFNLDFDAAFNKLRSGLSGESEPLKDLGILMNEDMVKAKALEMGLVKAGQELSNQAKVAARASIIMGGLKDAQGDLAKTADGFANASREATGRVGNLAASIGETLLPVVGKGLAEINVGIEALNLAWQGNKAAALDWAAGTVGGASQAAESMGWLQKTAGGVADAFQTIARDWKLAQASITEGVGEIIDRLSTLKPLISMAMGDFSGVFDKKNFGAFMDPNAGRRIGSIGDPEMKKWANSFKATAEAQRKEFEKAALAPDASASVNEYFDKARQKIDALRKDLARPAGVDFSKLGIAGGKEKADKAAKAPREGKAFSGAALAGSAEAASITLRSKFGDPSGKTQDQIAKNTNATASGVNKLAQAVQKLAANLSQPADLVTLDAMV
ncbi:hypothetical protein OJF2_65190 [Aquisphaera giovannonii]|uniref:Uncharacterized protein n=1 Tax=Aquisphaera giovannonii TaxID=406548 RepID=A0A5B9WCD1_9BACT|nr:hypothetical protein [Aquisphaera giovannonii]QEH37924.1 hypothetical protein OJF2_65190 [Aquisphaera giovannonii]